ncbi:hypothetical protein OsI_28289 [Oryza sativa Indica Group]|uniref:Reverse transcriptase zinc-binding domain-containing protein n=1 Tax=Oryza sativa subsp. indica TaxID=39946 RepID=B8BC01_ORYSI|nr:hypothetical protein OsI_28289 [Oryza sativa Indica Group]
MGLFKLPDSAAEDLTKLTKNFWWGADNVDTSFGGNVSLGWKAIEHGLSLLKEGIISRVGNGRLVRIWCDPWLPRDFSRRPISSKGTCRLKCVLDLINEDGSWNIHKINQYFLPLDAEIILRIRLPVREEEDFIAWHPIKHGRFSVRSAYSWALKLKNMSKCSGSSSEISCKAWDLIWKNAAPQKVKIFARKVAVNCLATKENKFKRTLESDALCSICGTANEDTAHALCQCPQARSLWLSMYDAGTILSVPAVWRMNPNWLFDQLAMLSEDERMQEDNADTEEVIVKQPEPGSTTSRVATIAPEPPLPPHDAAVKEEEVNVEGEEVAILGGWEDREERIGDGRIKMNEIGLALSLTRQNIWTFGLFVLPR